MKPLELDIHYDYNDGFYPHAIIHSYFDADPGDPPPGWKRDPFYQVGAFHGYKLRFSKKFPYNVQLRYAYDKKENRSIGVRILQ